MASRDLTGEFRERRNSKVALRQLEQWTEENVVDGLLTTSSESFVEDVEMGRRRPEVTPAWVAAFREVDVCCEKAQCELRRVVRAQRKRSKVTLLDQKEETSVERELRDAVETAKGQLRRAERLLKTKLEPEDEDSDATVRCKANAKKKLAAKVADLTRRFRLEKKPKPLLDGGGGTTEQQRQQHLGGSSSSSSSSSSSQSQQIASLDFLTSGAERRALDMLEARRPGDLIVTLEQAAAIEADSKFLDERDEEITRVARAVDDISHIFKELAVLVIDQGTILDRVDFNMEAVAERTRHATTQLLRAEAHDKDKRPLKTVLSLLLLVALLALILFLKLEKNRRREVGARRRC